MSNTNDTQSTFQIPSEPTVYTNVAVCTRADGAFFTDRHYIISDAGESETAIQALIDKFCDDTKDQDTAFIRKFCQTWGSRPSELHECYNQLESYNQSDNEGLKKVLEGSEYSHVKMKRPTEREYDDLINTAAQHNFTD